MCMSMFKKQVLNQCQSNRQMSDGHHRKEKKFAHCIIKLSFKFNKIEKVAKM